MPLATLLVPLESLPLTGLHQVGFIMFRPPGQKLLNIEQLFHWNLFKSKLKIIGEFGCVLRILGKRSLSKI
jgi:hypothetical protein